MKNIQLKQLLFSKVITCECKDAKQRNYKDTSSDFKELRVISNCSTKFGMSTNKK